MLPPSLHGSYPASQVLSALLSVLPLVAMLICMGKPCIATAFPAIFIHRPLAVYSPVVYTCEQSLRGNPTSCQSFGFLTCYRLLAILRLGEEPTGPPGLPHHNHVQRARVSDPGETVSCSPKRMYRCCLLLPKRHRLSRLQIPYGAQSLQHVASGPLSRCPTLKPGCYQTGSKDSLLVVG